ncbi:MAG: biotin--[acetyl-CoA-carboxylase] ligase [Gammaproteobacteria bacterium]|nr:biotin--[acetyl-CoA-carboxylase] ligase [Gammaproteobacteria bacterium]MBU1416354.1 biotin--[acetyl-CoA-carboxylase] ligase [Gammaproteobacteria bacterium]
MPEDRFSVTAVAAALGPLAPRFDIDVVAECESTNTLLLARAETSPSGAVLVAERQTAGRGRMGRPWHAEPAASLTFSLLYKLPRSAAPSGLSLAVGVAIAEALRELGVDGVALKWPNDILRDGRKLGGILIELSGSSAVVGIGLNLRLPADLPDDVRANAAALERDVDRNDLLARLLASLHRALDAFDSGGFAALRGRWSALNAYVGKPVRVISEFAVPVEGICMGVDVDGALLLETAVCVQRIISGDVSLRPA